MLVDFRCHDVECSLLYNSVYIYIYRVYKDNLCHLMSTLCSFFISFHLFWCFRPKKVPLTSLLDLGPGFGLTMAGPLELDDKPGKRWTLKPFRAGCTAVFILSQVVTPGWECEGHHFFRNKSHGGNHPESLVFFCNQTNLSNILGPTWWFQQFLLNILMMCVQI